MRATWDHDRIATDAAAAAARRVTSEVAFVIDRPVTLVLQMAVAPAAIEGGGGSERFSVVLDDVDLGPPTEVFLGGGRAHVVRPAGTGRLVAGYEAVVTPPPPPSAGGPDPLDAEVLEALRQSRYCPSDQLVGFARAELSGATGTEIARWVHDRVHYDIWATNPFGTAIDTLGTGTGVCRDFAHLTIALCRAIGVPARLVSVYAPGLSPMDFHAVVEIREQDRWLVVDPTRMAPRQSLVRIATGRDAADTAFADTIAGHALFDHVTVTATIDGLLPNDDHTRPVSLA